MEKEWVDELILMIVINAIRINIIVKIVKLFNG